MTVFAWTGLLIAMSCFSLAAWIYWRAPRKLLNNLMVLFNICVAVWGLGCMWAGVAKSSHEAIWAWRLANVGGFPLGMVFFHISQALCERPNRRVLISTYSFAVLAVLLCLSGVAMSETQWLFSSLHYYKANLLYVGLFIAWVAIVVVGHKRLFEASLRATGIKRIQLRVVCLAFATGFLGGTSALLPFIGIHLYPYGNFSIPLYTLIISYSIVKYGVTEMELSITKAGLLLGVYLVVLGLPFVIGQFWREPIEKILGESWWLVPLGTSTALATAGPFAYAYLRHQAELHLLGEQRKYQATLQHAAQGMTQVRSVHRLAELITRLVSRSVKITHASLFLWDRIHQSFYLEASRGPRRLARQSRYHLPGDDACVEWISKHQGTITVAEHDTTLVPAIRERLSQLGASLVVPGFIEQRLVGFLVLGDKISGDPYSSDDLHAFAMLTSQAAMALENATSYEELLKANEHLRSASERLARQERLAAAGQFAAGMAHEIKNPLSAIKTFAQYLPERYGDAEFREKFFRIVQSEIDRIGVIVRDLSDFAKPAPPQLKPVLPKDIIEDVLTLLSSQCLDRGITLQNHLSINGICVQADPQQLKQVILNLLLNAMEAMPRGGDLRVLGEVQGAFLLLSVQDTGMGMSPETQAKVWDPFFTTKERGMGLGLAIVRGIVERHGGDVTLFSAPNQGTTVRVSLPIAI